MSIRKVIYKSEMKIFILFGVFSGLLIQYFSFFPNSNGNDVFSALIFDHIPWYSTLSLLMLQLSMIFLYYSIDKQNKRDTILNTHRKLYLKVKQFCSPIIAIMIGLGLACLIIFSFYLLRSKIDNITLDYSYLKYSSLFLFFGIISFCVAFLSRGIYKIAANPLREEDIKYNLVKEMFRNISENSKILSIVSLVVLVVIATFDLHSDKKNFKETITLNKGEYIKIEQMAKDSNKSIEAYIRDKALKK